MGENVDFELVPKCILIVGNGFDLDLGYPTSYIDFVRSEWFDTLITGVPPKSLILEDHCSNNMTIFPNHLAQYIKKQEEHQNWVDLEKCIQEYCKSNVNIYDSLAVKKEFYALKYFLVQYLLRVQSNRSNSPLREYIEKKEKESLAYRLLEMIVMKNFDCDIWTFNYTYSCMDILDKLGMDSNFIDKKLHYIHGNLIDAQNNDKFSIVLGCNNDDVVFNFCPSVIKSNQNNEYCDIKQLWDENLSNAEVVIIMGHSLGTTDQQYFRDLFDLKNLKVIAIITKNQSSLDTMKVNLNKITDGKYGDFLEKGRIKFISFTSEGYYNRLHPLYDKKQLEFKNFLDNIKKSIYGNQYTIE